MRRLSIVTDRRVRIVALLGAGLLSIAAACADAGDGRHSKTEIMGWIENIALYPGGLELAAKLDTGARTSSVDVSGYEKFSRDGRQWVRFRVANRNGASVGFERPVVRIARIRRSEGKTVERPVVMLGLCLGTHYRDVEVNLAKRSHLNYAMLIGRSSMEGIAVDPSRKFMADATCRAPSKDGTSQ